MHDCSTATARDHHGKVRHLCATALGKQQPLRLFPNAQVCVAEAEADDYRAAVPGAILLLHSDDLLGMGRKRQWILDNVETEAVFMCDDDVDACIALTGRHMRKIVNPDDVLAIVRNAAECAAAVKTANFGFNHTADTRHIRAYRPFSFAGYVNGFAFGVVGRTVAFDALLDTKQDIDFSLTTLLTHRILWRDMRFAFRSSAWLARPGGMSGVRTRASMERDVERLQRKWGSVVAVENFRNAHQGKGKHRNVSIRVLR